MIQLPEHLLIDAIDKYNMGNNHKKENKNNKEKF